LDCPRITTLRTHRDLPIRAFAEFSANGARRQRH
jgi:hypothetical protein